jgi:hypothetical protein
MVTVAAVGLMALTTTAQCARAQAAAAAQTPAAPAKKAKAVKDTNEYDIYNDVIKDSVANPPNPKKFLTDLDNWNQKYPGSDFKDNRTFYYVQAYRANNEPAKALDYAKPLLDRGVDGLKEALDNPGTVLQMLFLTSALASAVSASGTATPDELATGAKAAQMLTDFGKSYFVKENKPATMSDADWAAGLKQVDDQAQATLFQLAMAPVVTALKGSPTDPSTNAAAEAALRTVMEKYPNSGLVAAQLAQVSLKQQSVSPMKTQQALYYFARAVSLPVGTVGGLDAKGQKDLDDYLKRSYTVVHGSDEGLADLKELAAKSPTMPADFKIKTSSEISAAAEEEFRTKNPQLAVWMGIKKSLADTGGEQYFETNMKGTMLAGENGAKFLKGTLLEAKPACRPKELLVAVPLPNAPGTPTAEITINVVDDQMKAAPLTGKPTVGGEIQFNGAPSAFTKEPFMLTLMAQKTDIEGITTTPCTATPTKAAPPAAKKKGGE